MNKVGAPMYLNIFSDSSRPERLLLTIKWDDGTAFTGRFTRRTLKQLAAELVQYELLEEEKDCLLDQRRSHPETVE